MNDVIGNFEFSSNNPQTFKKLDINSLVGNDFTLYQGTPSIVQGEKLNFLNRIVAGIRRFLGIQTHPDDFPQLLSIETGKPLRDIYKTMGTTVEQHNVHAMLSHFWSEMSFGIVPAEQQFETGSKIEDTLFGLGSGISDLAGFVVAMGLGSGELRGLSTFGKYLARFDSVADKLDALRPFVNRIVNYLPRSELIARAVKSAGSLGVMTAMENIVQQNEKTNNIYQALKDIEPDIISNAVLGAGLPFVELSKSNIFKPILAIALGEAPRYVLSGTTSFSGVINGIKTGNLPEIANNIFNIALESWMGITAVKPSSSESSDIEKGLSKDAEFMKKEKPPLSEPSPDTVLNITKIYTSGSQKPSELSEAEKRILDFDNTIKVGEVESKESESKDLAIQEAPEIVKEIDVNDKETLNKVLTDLENMGVEKSPSGDMYVTADTDVNDIVKRYPFVMFHVKDTNGVTAVFTAKSFERLIALKPFEDRVRSVMISLKAEPRVDKNFMNGMFAKDYSKYLKDEHAEEEYVEPIEKVVLQNNSTVSKTQQRKFVNAVRNKTVRENLKELGIKKVTIEPPYKFDVGEEGRVSVKNKIVELNADAENPTVTLLHEIGHVKYNMLTEKEKEEFKKRVDTINSKTIEGYKKLKKYEEIYSEAFAYQGKRKWADKLLGITTEDKSESKGKEDVVVSIQKPVDIGLSIIKTDISSIEKEEHPELQTLKMYGGMPIDKILEPVEQLVENRAMKFTNKDMDIFSFALVNPFFAQYSKNPEVAEIFKELDKMNFEVEKVVEKVRTPLFNISDEFGGLLKQIKDEDLKKSILDSIVEGDAEGKNPKDIFLKKNPDIPAEERERIEKIFDKHQEFYKTAREFLNKHIKSLMKRLADNTSLPKQKLEKLEKVMYRQIKEYPYYMHRARGVGNVIFRVYDAEDKVIYMKPLTDIGAFLLRDKGKPISFMADLEKRKWIKEHPDYNPEEITFDVKFKQKNAVPKPELLDIVEYLADVLDETDLDKKEKDAIISKAIDKILAEGFMSHAKARSKRLIEGYYKDPVYAMGSYLAQLTGFIQKQETKYRINDILKDVYTRNPVLSAALRRYKEELLRQKDAVDKVVNSVRKFLFVKYLAFSVRNMFVNVFFQIPVITAMHTAVEISDKAAGLGDFAKAEEIVMKATKDVLSNNLSDKEKEVLDYLNRLGITKDQRTSYTLGRSILLSGTISKLMDATGIFMKVSEELNRKASALAYIRCHSDWSTEELVEGARDFVYLTNGKYGDDELSFIFQGKGSAARILRIGQTFQSYVHQMLLGMKKLYNEKQYTALLMGLGALMFLGGMASLPVYSTVKSVYTTVTGRDLDMDIEKMLGKAGWLWEWLKGGLFANLPFGLGVDVTSSAALNLPTDELQFMGDNPLEIAGKLAFGVAGQSVTDMWKALDYLEKGDLDKAFYYGIPLRFAVYPLKALKEYYRGIDTNGDLLLEGPDGKLLKLSEKEALLQALGFTPARISEFKDLYYTWKNLKHYYQIRREDLYNTVRLAVQEGDKESYREAVLEMMELNKRIMQLNREYGLGLPLANVNTVKTISAQKSFRNFMLLQGGR